MSVDRILVIKLSALGDLVLSMPACEAIREAHPKAHITLLTTAPFRGLMEDCPYFDAVRVDPRRRLYTPSGFLGTARMLREGDPQLIYDLQTADRTGWYFRALAVTGGAPPWSGNARGCAFPHANPDRNNMHTLERQADQLAMAGLPRKDPVPPPDLSWARADVTGLLPDGPFALLIPGGSPHREMKRWPVDRFAALAQRLVKEGVVPVVLGTDAEAEEAGIILRACPEALSLVNRTTIHQIASLATRACLAVGGDTGPLHLVAAAGAPSLGLYSEVSIPALCAPRGRDTDVLWRKDLRDLPVGPVAEAAVTLISARKNGHRVG
ncbi:MAG: glycosyltransferase family 9 protein [Rhodospirillum sp.]|nr:glycosyltransferase family 9 protein [Rhodospirillum sp.]MCF8487927.1 glycosyltransferase family 9 protein [Rhodospirillum sp.]MCF8500672.1 glycosyltransferase family 9 protein [Rhodospirillum sp.]